MRTTTTPATVSAPAASLRRKSVWRRSMAYVLPVESGGAGALAGEVDGGTGGGEKEDHAVAGAEPAQGPVVLPAEPVEGRAGRRERSGGPRGGGDDDPAGGERAGGGVERRQLGRAHRHLVGDPQALVGELGRHPADQQAGERHLELGGGLPPGRDGGDRLGGGHADGDGAAAD